MRVVKEAGIGWSLARTWEGDRNRERQLKKQGGASRCCPVCKGQPARPQPVTIEASYRLAVPAPRREVAAVEPPPLWESVVSHLEPAEAAALLGELGAAERAAWDAATPDAGTEYGSRFDAACELSRLRGDEASAAGRLAEARAIAQAEGWADEPADRPFDRQAARRPELPRAQGARVKEDRQMGITDIFRADRGENSDWSRERRQLEKDARARGLDPADASPQDRLDWQRQDRERDFEAGS